MSFRHLWQRYFLKEILKVFSLFLFSFFFLYSLIDYSMHLQEILKNETLSLKGLFLYYGMLFSKRCDLLLPLSLLIASVKVLTSLNKRNELLALQTAGIPLHVLTRPFFFVSLLCVSLSYLNFELIAPKSLTYIDRFEKKHLKNSPSKENVKGVVNTLPLIDGGRVIYQSYDPETKELFDLFWIKSSDHVIHMKTLSIGQTPPEGTFLDELERNPEGKMEKVASFPSLELPDLHIDFSLEHQKNLSMENQSISELGMILLNQRGAFTETLSAAATHLYFKLVMPWLPVLVLIGVIPYCVPSSRSLSTFLIFALTIFGYIAFFTIMDGCIILGEMQVISPFWAIFALPLLFLFYFGFRFSKMCFKK